MGLFDPFSPFAKARFGRNRSAGGGPAAVQALGPKQRQLREPQGAVCSKRSSIAGRVYPFWVLQELRA